ncbi:DUF1266 domain-containing protein [Gorillibacterium sp. CAU 1737]|uniref:DUF1266 domain-containing protein n=1 Tax=Gorillibacterium sp. CAU 1737 TaxID=3140362 RepID=UPI003261CD44
MPQSLYTMKTKWEPFAHAMLAFFPKGPDADYFITNPKSIFRNRYGTLSLLDRMAGIDSASGLSQDLEWRISTGIRHEFSKIYRELEWLPEAERMQRIEAITHNPLREKYTVANHYLRRMPSGGIAAFDATYSVFYSMAGERLDWLTADETWTLIGRSVHLAQSHYTNWYDYCTGFVAGLDFTFPTQLQDKKEREQRLRRLLGLSGNLLKDELFPDVARDAEVRLS